MRSKVMKRSKEKEVGDNEKDRRRKDIYCPSNKRIRAAYKWTVWMYALVRIPSLDEKDKE